MTPDPEVTAYVARRFEVEKRQERGPFGDRIKSIDPQEFLLQRQERIDRMIHDATRNQRPPAPTVRVSCRVASSNTGRSGLGGDGSIYG